MNNLFNDQLFNKYLNKIQITQEQKDNITLWNQKLNNGELIAETSNYHYFEKIFLNSLLCYDSFTDVLADDKEVNGSGKSEFKLKIDNKVFMIIELKGSNVNLDKDRNNKKETPVDQVFRYAKKNEAVPWLLVSNYNEFRLYNYHKGDGKYIAWNMKELSSDENKLKEFIFILGKTSYEQGIIDKLIDQTIIIQEDFNDEFYKLYSETRLMLIHDLEKQSEDMDRLKAIHYAQLIMDRVIFICFAEDKELLPKQILEDTILKPIKENNVRKHRIFDRLRELFEDVHEGNSGKKVSGYNGGLFQERLGFLNIQDTIENPSEYYKDCFSNWKFESKKNKMEKLLGEYKDTLNPIYKNIITMTIFKFDSEVDVNILGHIFESSISDIEKLKEDNSETRHKFGIHYTPQEITEYICRNTIIPYLSKTGNANEIPELLSEYENDINTLDKKLKDIKILDPACGSGAFLNKAVDVLLEIHEAVWHQKYDNQKNLDKYFDNQSVRREIILDNIYGVDLNEESTEITKLGLFLKICKKDKKLPSLDKNIKCGNSVIDDPEYAGDKAFKWEEEFKEIFINLHQGSTGEDVKTLQNMLNELGYYKKQIDGNFGKYTKQAVKAYQKANDLDADGCFGPKTCETFKWKEEFKEMLDNSGFDAIIGNPPYVRQELFKEDKPYYKEHYETYTGVADLYVYFFEKGFNVLKYKGYFGYICSNKWIKTQYGKNLRKYILNYTIKNYYDYTGKKIFQDATVDVSIIILEKNNRSNNQINVNEEYYINQSNLTKDNYSFEKEEIFNLKQKIHNKGIELKKLDVKIDSGLKTGLNEVFIINQDKYERFIHEDYNTKNILEPVLRGRDIWKHKIYFNNLYLINSYDGLNIEEEYPIIYNYLLEHYEKVKNRGDQGKYWYNLRSCAYLNEFKKEKIIYSTISTEPCFVYDNKGYFLNNSAYIMTSDTINLKYLNALLTSNVLYYYFKGLGTDYGGKASPYRKIYIEQLPIVIAENELSSQIIYLLETILVKNREYVNEILNYLKWLQGEYNIDKLSQKLEKYYELSFDEFLEELRKKKVNTKKRAVRENLEEEFNNSLDIIKPLQQEIQVLEDEINQKVYMLYGLTDDEIKIIEESLSS